MTNRGLCIRIVFQELPSEFLDQLHVSEWDTSADQYLLVPLNCAHQTTPDTPFSIILKRKKDNTYVRPFPAEDMAFEKYFQKTKEALTRRMVYITEPTNEFITASSFASLSSEATHTLSFIQTPPDFQVWYVTPPGYAQRAALY
ncbi:MAG: hypothetical protein Q9218_007332, partial [Villophora microphyllina]